MHSQLAFQEEELMRNRGAMQDHERDMSTMEAEIQQLLAKMEGKDSSIQELRAALKSLE